MKKVGLFFIGLLVSIFCLTSCIEGSNVTSGEGFGVLDQSSKGLLPVLKTGGVDLYSPLLSSEISGGRMGYDQCYWFTYTLDHDLPENADKFVESNGYFTITLTGYAPIPKYYVSSYLTDISSALPDEKPLLKGYNGGIFVEGYFFMEHHVNQPSEMELDWLMSYDYDAMPTEEGGNRYYDV